jgi:hypothetical protein
VFSPSVSSDTCDEPLQKPSAPPFPSKFYV